MRVCKKSIRKVSRESHETNKFYAVIKFSNLFRFVWRLCHFYDLISTQSGKNESIVNSLAINTRDTIPVQVPLIKKFEPDKSDNLNLTNLNLTNRNRWIKPRQYAKLAFCSCTWGHHNEIWWWLRTLKLTECKTML